MYIYMWCMMCAYTCTQSSGTRCNLFRRSASEPEVSSIFSGQFYPSNYPWAIPLDPLQHQLLRTVWSRVLLRFLELCRLFKFAILFLKRLTDVKFSRVRFSFLVSWHALFFWFSKVAFPAIFLCLFECSTVFYILLFAFTCFLNPSSLSASSLDQSSFCWSSSNKQMGTGDLNHGASQILRFPCNNCILWTRKALDRLWQSPAGPKDTFRIGQHMCFDRYKLRAWHVSLSS